LLCVTFFFIKNPALFCILQAKKGVILLNILGGHIFLKKLEFVIIKQRNVQRIFDVGHVTDMWLDVMLFVEQHIGTQKQI
jgi:hypothetical protein